MAHKSIWFQGKKPFVVPECDGRIPQTCPLSKRIAAEYNRGYYTLTNVLVPNVMYDDIGYELPLKQELRELKVGDYLWMILVPPQHMVIDMFIYNDTTNAMHSNLDTMGGITLSLVSGKFSKADSNGDCGVSGEKVEGTIVMPAGPNAKQQFVVSTSGTVLDAEKWVGIGIKIDALPNNKTLADIVGRIVVGAHVVDYDAQVFM